MTALERRYGTNDCVHCRMLARLGEMDVLECSGLSALPGERVLVVRYPYDNAEGFSERIISTCDLDRPSTRTLSGDAWAPVLAMLRLLT